MTSRESARACFTLGSNGAKTFVLKRFRGKMLLATKSSFEPIGNRKGGFNPPVKHKVPCSACGAVCVLSHVTPRRCRT